MNKNGWKMIGTQCCGPAGSVVIYDETSAGNDHAAFSVGGGLICQHNPGRCRCSPTIPNCSVRHALPAPLAPSPPVVCVEATSDLTRPRPAAPRAIGARIAFIATAAEIDASKESHFVKMPCQYKHISYSNTATRRCRRST